LNRVRQGWRGDRRDRYAMRDDVGRIADGIGRDRLHDRYDDRWAQESPRRPPTAIASPTS
jgi:hypothetical protein